MDDINIYEFLKKHKYEFKNDIPVLKKDNFDLVDWNNVKVINFRHRKTLKKKNNVVFVFFNDDKVLESVWNNPRIGIITYEQGIATATPDFSVRSTMSFLEQKRNICRNRLMGCFWQAYGLKIIPTMQWCGKDTYDLVFNTIEEGTPVIISTMGCHKNPKEFLDGYNVMMDIVKPSIVICVGGLIDGMFGTILPFNLRETFAQQKYEQIKLPGYVKAIHIERGSNLVTSISFEDKINNLIKNNNIRVNEYKCIEDFVNEYDGKFELGDEFHQGLEFKYKGQEYRICREYDTTFYVYRIEDKWETHSYEYFVNSMPVFKTLGIVETMEGLLESTFIDRRPFKEVIMDDNTMILSKD